MTRQSMDETFSELGISSLTMRRTRRADGAWGWIAEALLADAQNVRDGEILPSRVRTSICATSQEALEELRGLLVG